MILSVHPFVTHTIHASFSSHSSLPARRAIAGRGPASPPRKNSRPAAPAAGETDRPEPSSSAAAAALAAADPAARKQVSDYVTALLKPLYNSRRITKVSASLKPTGHTWSCLACVIGHRVPIRQPYVGSSFQ
jgi:hypothetical protein